MQTKSYNTARGKGVKAASAALAKEHLALKETASPAYSQTRADSIQTFIEFYQMLDYEWSREGRVGWFRGTKVCLTILQSKR